MTAGVEAGDGLAWIEAQLQADAQWVAACLGGVHLGMAPQGTTAPVCALWVQSAPEYLTAFGVRIWTTPTIMVKHSGPSDSFTAVRSCAARAYAVLDHHVGATQGALIKSCILGNQFPLPEPKLVNGVQWLSYVQLYDLIVQ